MRPSTGRMVHYVSHGAPIREDSNSDTANPVVNAILHARLGNLKKEYRQDSIALNVSDTEFV